METNKFTTNLITIIAFLFVCVSIFGIYSIMGIRIAGVVLTYYRVIIPLLFVCVLARETLRTGHLINREENHFVKYAYIILILWSVYGFISVFVSPWSVLDRGLKEILGICLGIMSIYISIYLYNQNKFHSMILAIKISMCILILIGYIEILTGWHLNTSMLSEPAYIAETESLYTGEDMSNNVSYIATGIFYNPNDYCAFLSIFSPVFLYREHEKVYMKLFSYIMLFFIFLILLVDDAWICVVALNVSCVLYLILSKANVFEYVLMILTFLCARCFGNVLIDLNHIVMYKFFGSEPSFKPSVTISNIENTLGVQVENASQGQGSLYYRFNTYIEGMKEMFLQSKGLGLGAGSYQNYFSDIAVEKNLIANPHSLWIEILVQYGGMIFLLVVILMVMLLVKLFQQYSKTRAQEILLIISIGISFALACFAPSNFLLNSYYWIIIGMGIAMVSKSPDQLE